MEYRREIDGLRAVAVLPVIFFHAGFSWFRGGYVGVDVFFVISGYLITTIILMEKEKGTFSIVNFYERRARRILPPLFFMSICCLPFAWFWLLPDHLKDFSESLIAVSLFSSNFLFLQESGYFATANELKPLLHTWSLAVEEQYYLLFPLLLMVMWKLRKRWIFGGLVLIAVSSVALAHYGAYSNPEATFYLLPTRIWEIAIGAIVAFYFLYRKKHVDWLTSQRSVCEVFSVIGILLIFYSIYSFDKTTPFPSLYALLPTIGTALIIFFSNQDTTVGKFLGSKIFVGIGMVSYGTYLWHQPLIVFARHRSLGELSSEMLLVLAFASFVMAFISWKYIEVPFRNKSFIGRRGVYAAAIVFSLALIIVGGVGIADNGWVSRADKETYAAIADAKNVSYPKESSKFWLLPRENKADSDAIFLLGDSFSGQFSSGLRNYAREELFSYGESFLAGCPPVLGLDLTLKVDGVDCEQRNEVSFKRISEDGRIKTVIVIANWTGYLEKYNLYTNEFLSAYSYSLNKLLQTGKNIVLLYPIPIYTYDIPDAILKASFIDGIGMNEKDPSFLSVSYSEFRQKNEKVYRLFDSFTGYRNLIKVYPEKVFCNQMVAERCVVYDGKEIYYRDHGHLSKQGINLVIKEISGKLAQNKHLAGR